LNFLMLTWNYKLSSCSPGGELSYKSLGPDAFQAVLVLEDGAERQTAQHGGARL